MLRLNLLFARTLDCFVGAAARGKSARGMGGSPLARHYIRISYWREMVFVFGEVPGPKYYLKQRGTEGRLDASGSLPRSSLIQFCCRHIRSCLLLCRDIPIMWADVALLSTILHSRGERLDCSASWSRVLASRPGRTGAQSLLCGYVSVNPDFDRLPLM
ncbi:MAG TPA: hypothetical protein VH684_24725 [Xanthobacteraceae bacterium]|jgi:hypothetical protein